MTPQLSKEAFLLLENASLKLSLMKRDVADAESRFRELVKKTFADAGADESAYVINMQTGQFCPKNQ
jgi:hypothetical protein